MRRLPRSLLAAALASVGLMTAPAALAAAGDVQVRSYAPDGQWDPQLRAARFAVDDGRYLDATIELRNLVARAGDKRLPPQLQQLLATASLGFGLPQPAEHTYRELRPTTSDPLALGRAQLDLATQLYDHGDTQRAADLLNAVHQRLPDKLQPEWNGLMGRVLLRLNRAGPAATVLKRATSGPNAAFARYNLAVALLRTGDTKAGVKALESAGTASVHTPEQLALRDYANLVLGYNALRHKQPGRAIDAFDRVRVKGPFSNRALLGLGWAYLALSGTVTLHTGEPAAQSGAPNTAGTLGLLLRSGFITDSILDSKRVRMMRHALPHRITVTGSVAGGDSNKQVRRALVPWAELLSRDPMDPAVQEGMMAVPYALEKVGAHQEALNYYETAIQRLQQTRQRISAARSDVASGRMINTMIAADPEAQTGWNWRLVDLPDAVETFYLQRTIAEHPFQEGLKDYRDLRLLDATLAKTQQRLTQLMATPPDKRPHAASVQYLIQRAQRRGAPVPSLGHGQPIALATSTELGSAGLPQAPLAASPATPPAAHSPARALGLAPPPAAGFHGPAQRIPELQAEITALQPQIKTATEVAAKRLTDIALAALTVQDATAKKYLIEVRLAVARIYDHQSAVPGFVPESVPDMPPATPKEGKS
ncbi:MAG TPA: tetratricopeptide repeat protein [Nevskiaceae bacterium]|nr:tetratricopeptide repeat protein [Nevskiaceae bacterium]